MSLAEAFMGYAQSEGRNFLPILKALREPSVQPVDEAPGTPSGTNYRTGNSGPQYGRSLPVKLSGKTMILPTRWKGTHVTSGLDWNQGQRTAEDIMASAGTIVGAPEPGKVVYFHPTGAQGGGSMLFDPDAPGPNYWIGHIAQGLSAGTRIKRRGQRIALVSPEHAAPHVHIDRDW